MAIWLPALLAIWVPLTWATRVLIPQMMGGNVTVFAAELLHALAMAFRPDVLIALLLVQRSASRDVWHATREEMAVTFLTAGPIIVGKAIVPVALLSVFHAFGIWYYYAELLTDPIYQLPLWLAGPSIPLGIPIMGLAFAEDVLFATVVVLIALRCFLLGTDPFHATLQAIARLLVFGLLVCLCSWAWPLIYNLMPFDWSMWLIIDLRRFLITSNLAWFSMILPMEIAVIVFVSWRLRKRLNRWLRME
jgi:hypothetical protein